jgi:hypothetical protein
MEEGVLAVWRPGWQLSLRMIGRKDVWTMLKDEEA